MNKKIKCKGKTIKHCWEECPYFGVEHGHVMWCEHPRAISLCKKTVDLSAIYIISHPQCDEGFPELCPLAYPGLLEKRWKEDRKKESNEKKAMKNFDEEIKKALK